MMKSTGEFEPGDVVKVVKSGHGVSGDNIGKTTTVTEYSPDGYDGKPGVQVIDFKNPGYYNDWIGINSFKLVKPVINLQKLVDDLDKKIEAMERKVNYGL